MFTVTFAPINGKLCQPIGLKHTHYIPNTYPNLAAYETLTVNMTHHIWSF